MNQSSVDEAKHRLAGRMQAVRRAAHRAAGRDTAARIAGSFHEARQRGLVLERGWVVSGYWPIRDEVDIRRLLADLHADGMQIALPVVAGRDRPLLFRRWRPGDGLEQGVLGLSEPAPGVPELTPRVVLTPLLAVDMHGNRLGYGGGYYDRTLRTLRTRGPVTAVGIAFDAQRIDDVPHDGRDEPLDWIVTEKGAYCVGG